MARKQRGKGKSSTTHDGSNEEVVSEHFKKEEPERKKSLDTKEKGRGKSKTAAKVDVTQEVGIVSKHFVKSEILGGDRDGEERCEDNDDDFQELNPKKRKITTASGKISSKLKATTRVKEETATSQNVKTRSAGVKRKLQKDEGCSGDETYIDDNKDHRKTKDTGAKRKSTKTEQTCPVEVKGQARKAKNKTDNKKVETKESITSSIETDDGKLKMNEQSKDKDGLTSRKRKKQNNDTPESYENNEKKVSETIINDKSQDSPIDEVVKKKAKKKQAVKENKVPKEKKASKNPTKGKQTKQTDDIGSVINKDTKINPINTSDVISVLMHMEGPSTSQGHNGSKVKVDSDEMMSDSNSDEVAEQDSDNSEEDWEEVEDHHGNSPKKSQTPSQSVEITLEGPTIYKKRKRKGFDLNQYLKKQVNKYKRELALDMHKETNLANCIETRTISNNIEFSLVCIMILRHLGFMTRLVMSLQPVPFKQAQKVGTQRPSKQKKNTQKKTKPPKTEPKETKPKTSSKSKNNVSKSVSTSDSKHNVKKKILSDKKLSDIQTETSSASKRGKRRCSKNLSRGAYKEEKDDANDEDLDDDIEFMDTDDSDSDNDERNVSVGKGKKKGKLKSGKSSGNKEPVGKEEDRNSSSDSEFEQDSIIMRTMPLKREPSKTRNRKVLSSASDVASGHISDKKNNLIGHNDTWLEVYIEAENKWISVCSQSREIAKPSDIRSHASFPLYYVVGVDNNGAIKDITVRYASEWLTKTRKLRIEGDWWTETLAPFRPHDKDRDAVEDKDLQTYLLQCPIPSSVSQLKGHPLFILKRHLLKYEALYPNSIVPVGYVRGEPVYSRECCHTLHSRENWLKEGRAVRLGEEPYKFVKSRKRWNDKDSEPKDCELFGEWQTEIYIPPPAVDGVVPRNAHGNVEMFQPWMLPAGTVHLKGLPGLNRIARKLNLDCAAAMVGWDHHCGFAHPVMDGWIVCEEHKDIFLAAWDEEQEIIQQREIEKKEKRVYGNWKKLIRGLLIKERLKKRYEEKPVHEPTTEQKQVKAEESEEMATDVQQSWPRNRLIENKSSLGVVETL